MADKNFGVKKIELIGSSGTPNLTSPNNLNLNAVTVAISTDVTIGGKVQSDVIVGTGYSVGIGTTNPTEELEIYGSGNIGLKATGVNGADSTYFEILSIPSAGNVSLTVDSVGSWNNFETFSIYTAGTRLINCIKNPSGNAVSLGNGSSNFYNFSGLDVQGNIGINGQTIFDTNRRVTRTLYPDTDNTYDLGGVIGATPYTWRNASFSGSVGIGTTNPTAKLTVGGDVSVSAEITAANFRTNSTVGDGSDVGFAIKYYITANGTSAYRFAGPGLLNTTDNPTFYLQRGFTYIFENSTGGSHPFRIQFTGTTTGVGTYVSGSQTGTQVFTVPFDAPSSYQYQCTIHGGMLGTFNVA